MRALLSLVLLVVLPSCHRSGPPDLFSFDLPRADGTRLVFSSLREKKASTFVFLAPDCPLSQNYTQTLNELKREFSSGFTIYGVIAGNLYTKEEIEEFVHKYKIEFPLLLDRDFGLADYFAAEVTPQVFVADSNAQVVYAGAIDNWAGSLGQHRVEASERYLYNTLNDLREGRPVRVRDTRPVGCYIERKDLPELSG